MVAGHKSSGFWGSIAQLYEIIQPGQRRELGILVILTLAGAVSEVIAIGSVVPFLALLSEQSTAAHLPWLPRLFHALGAETRSAELALATGLLCGGAVAAGILRIALTRKTQEFAFLFGHRLSVEIQRRMLLQPYSWHIAHNSSEQLATIEKVEIVATAVLLPLIQSVAATVIVVVVLALLIRITPGATIIAAIVLGAAYLGFGAFARRQLDASSRQLDTAFEERIRTLQEGLAGIRDIILDRAHSGVLSQFRDVDFALADARSKTAFISTIPRYLVETVGIIVIAGLALFVSGRAGGLIAALPVLGALALGAQRLLPLVQQLYHGWSNVAANRSVIDDLVWRLRLRVPTVLPVTRKLPFKRAIEFREVSFAYEGRSETAVSDLTFEIPRRSRTALVGPTGSGKSTSADLLMGLLDPTRGSIAVDGAVLDDENRDRWRANVAHVPQMLFLADASIAENIALTGELDMGRVREAASLAQLDRFISSLPDGFETRVGERGARISGGQRQRLALARAIYKNTPLLVLDEATSGVDNHTEAAILRALDHLQEQGRTIVIIAHRSMLIESCDQMLRLENGRIVEIYGPDRSKSLAEHG